MRQSHRGTLIAAAQRYGTPLYVYMLDDVRERIARLRYHFGKNYALSYAVKSNPNPMVLTALGPLVDRFDVSSIEEARRVLSVGIDPELVSFSGPAKRDFELTEAVDSSLGEVVCESVTEAEKINVLAKQRKCNVKIMLRINPARVPRQFGVNMAGKPSQFGIDEEVLEPAIQRVMKLSHVKLVGFHIYSGTNSLSEDAIIENFSIFAELFRHAAQYSGVHPRRLIFGSGFGIPYLPEDKALDLRILAPALNQLAHQLRNDPLIAEAELVLEMGRWIVGPAGYLVTSVIGEKYSRGSEIRLCDAGFNNHLAACGMMGTVIRRNWLITLLTDEDHGDTLQPYNLVGPLCTTIDSLATNIEFPNLSTGDLLAIHGSGAYGLTASPTRFISHPEPREVLFSEAEGLIDISERPSVDLAKH